MIKLVQFRCDIYIKTEEEDKTTYKLKSSRFFTTLTGCFNDLRTVIDNETTDILYYSPYKYVITPLYREDGKNAEEETHKDL